MDGNAPKSKLAEDGLLSCANMSSAAVRMAVGGEPPVLTDGARMEDRDCETSGPDGLGDMACAVLRGVMGVGAGDICSLKACSERLTLDIIITSSGIDNDSG